MSLLSLNQFTILADGLDHPEGVAWGPDGNIYAGGEAGQIYRIGLDGRITELATTGGSILGVCVDGRSNVYACDFKNKAVMRISPAGAVSVYSDGARERKMTLPNYAVFDRAGNLFVSDSGGWHENNGCLFRIAPGGETSVVSTEVAAFPNGMALSPREDRLYIVLSNLPGVVKLSFAEDGSVGPPQPVVELPRSVPDGLAFDNLGGLYISCYAPDLIYHFSVDGRLEILVADEERTRIASPTNLAFVGAELSTLVAANYGGWHLIQTKSSIPGFRLPYPLVPERGVFSDQ
jgi:gluconolactonase